MNSPPPTLILAHEILSSAGDQPIFTCMGIRKNFRVRARDLHISFRLEEVSVHSTNHLIKNNV